MPRAAVGLRGTEDLGGGLKAIFVLENGFNSGNGTIGQGGAIFGRQAYVGLSQSQYGTVTFGRQYSFSTDILGSNYSTGGNTVAGNYAYHVNDLDQLTSSRINNAVKFQSANYSGFTFGALYGFELDGLRRRTGDNDGHDDDGRLVARIQLRPELRERPVLAGRSVHGHPLPEPVDAGFLDDDREYRNGQRPRPAHVRRRWPLRLGPGNGMAAVDAYAVLDRVGRGRHVLQRV